MTVLFSRQLYFRSLTAGRSVVGGVGREKVNKTNSRTIEHFNVMVDLQIRMVLVDVRFDALCSIFSVCSVQIYMRVHDGLLICTYYDGAYLELSYAVVLCLLGKSFSLGEFLVGAFCFMLQLLRSLHELIGKLWFLYSIGIVYDRIPACGSAQFYRCIYNASHRILYII